MDFSRKQEEFCQKSTRFLGVKCTSDFVFVCLLCYPCRLPSINPAGCGHASSEFTKKGTIRTKCNNKLDILE